MRLSIVTAIATLLLLGNAPATHALDLDRQQIVDSSFDAVLLRPLAATSLLVGGALFVPGALLAAPMGWKDGIDQVYEQLVDHQYDALVTRPLGDF